MWPCLFFLLFVLVEGGPFAVGVKGSQKEPPTAFCFFLSFFCLTGGHLFSGKPQLVVWIGLDLDVNTCLLGKPPSEHQTTKPPNHQTQKPTIWRDDAFVTQPCKKTTKNAGGSEAAAGQMVGRGLRTRICREQRAIWRWGSYGISK